ncbi:hypothetical protein GQ43DRAFT_448425 [Delitschia confertaspora ATCC 74209]|uniref:Cyclin N-terminal domain-containing protein n=1 Tax=Delitschia confertaspora ATCC 74209 TaxID=1513339 RepID=A0A9P4JRQ2_9PLEO|nr:hypothetical protein GQ43DRAFT_448425 [Delitschia confertaspora ATCC 74209]
MSDEELDRYFANYVPLSNLPTPPPAKEENMDGPATQLANLVPSNASTRRPSTSIIHEFLVRSNLPIETIAFASCILDALSTRFVSTWRNISNPNSHLDFDPVSNHFITACKAYGYSTPPRAVEPELIVLAALSLAVAFLEDRGQPPRYWTEFVAEEAFTIKDFTNTEIYILRDIDYGLHRFGMDMVQEAMSAMECARGLMDANASSPNTTKDGNDSGSAHGRESKRLKRSLRLSLPGEAVWWNGVHTPGPSP